MAPPSVPRARSCPQVLPLGVAQGILGDLNGQVSAVVLQHLKNKKAVNCRQWQGSLRQRLAVHPQPCACKCQGQLRCACRRRQGPWRMGTCLRACALTRACTRPLWLHAARIKRKQKVTFSKQTCQQFRTTNFRLMLCNAEPVWNTRTRMRICALCGI